VKGSRAGGRKFRPFRDQVCPFAGEDPGGGTAADSSPLRTTRFFDNSVFYKMRVLRRRRPFRFFRNRALAMFPFDGGILPVLARSAVRLSGGRVSGHLEDDFWLMLMVKMSLKKRGADPETASFFGEMRKMRERMAANKRGMMAEKPSSGPGKSSENMVKS